MPFRMDLFLRSVFRIPRGDGKVLFHAVGSEDLPVSLSEDLDKGFSFLRAQHRVGIDRCHQHGGVLVVMCLFLRQTVSIYVYVIRLR